MYQVNIPALYSELENKDEKKIKFVIIIGTILACVLYIMAGLFGFMSFAANTTDEELSAIFTDNILKAPYHKEGDAAGSGIPLVIYISLFGMCLVVTIATPFCVLPCKDGIEEIKNRKFTKNENIIWTIVCQTIPAVIAMPFLSISLPMAILGATTNSAVGFFLPIIYYIKLEHKQPKYSNMKIICYAIFVFIAFSSVMELVLLVVGLV